LKKKLQNNKKIQVVWIKKLNVCTFVFWCVCFLELFFCVKN
jgi:hypothetical protein